MTDRPASCAALARVAGVYRPSEAVVCICRSTAESRGTVTPDRRPVWGSNNLQLFLYLFHTRHAPGDLLGLLDVFHGADLPCEVSGAVRSEERRVGQEERRGESAARAENQA